MPTDDDYERLGIALTEKLHAMRKRNHIEPTQAFQARLEREFAAAGVSRSERAAGRMRRWAITASLPAAAAVAAAILLFVASDSSPAFAVTRGTGGKVTITLNDIAGVSGANAKLRDLGVNNVVVVPIAADCTAQIAMSYIGTGSTADSPVTVTPGAVPEGTTIVLGAEEASQGQIEEAIGEVSGTAPACVEPAPAGGNGTPTGPVIPHAAVPADRAGNS